MCCDCVDGSIDRPSHESTVPTPLHHNQIPTPPLNPTYPSLPYPKTTGPEAVADKLEGAHPAELGKKVQALAASAGSSAGGGAGAAPVAAVAVNKPTEQENGAAAAAKGDLEERCVLLCLASGLMWCGVLDGMVVIWWWGL